MLGRYQVRSMLHFHSPNPHYESGATRVAGVRDSVKVKAAMEMNTFTSETTYMINTSSGHCADNDVKDNLINVKEQGWRALSDSIQMIRTVVRLTT